MNAEQSFDKRNTLELKSIQTQIPRSVILGSQAAKSHSWVIRHIGKLLTQHEGAKFVVDLH